MSLSLFVFSWDTFTDNRLQDYLNVSSAILIYTGKMGCQGDQNVLFCKTIVLHKAVLRSVGAYCLLFLCKIACVGND